MRGFITILKRELRAYYSSPIAYATGAVFLIITGFFNFFILTAYNEESMLYARNPQFAGQMSLNANEMALPPLLSNMGVILLFVVPLLTMRLLAEEKRSGTDELLFTAPVTTLQIVLGKFGAASVLTILFLIPTGIGAYFFDEYAGIEWLPVLSGYLGVILMTSAFIAIGLFASSMTENQIVAAVVTFGALLMFWVIGWSGENPEGLVEKALAHLSLYNHLEEFTKGVINTKDIIYYLSITVFGLFLTHQTLESKRWR